MMPVICLRWLKGEVHSRKNFAKVSDFSKNNKSCSGAVIRQIMLRMGPGNIQYLNSSEYNM